MATSRLSEFLSNISSHFPYYGALMCAVIPVNPLKFNLYNLSKKINKKWIEMTRSGSRWQEVDRDDKKWIEMWDPRWPHSTFVPCFNVARCHHTQDITDFPFNLWPKFGVWVQDVCWPASFLIGFFVCFRCAMKTWYLKWFPKIILPRKLTCSLKINGWKMYFLLNWSLFRGHVSFQGYTNLYQSLDSEIWDLSVFQVMILRMKGLKYRMV